MNKSEFPPNFESDIKNVAIDFDGVIHNNNRGWYDGTCYGEPIEGSLEAIKELSKNFNIIIFTAKAKDDRPQVNGKTGVMLVREWCIKYGIMDNVKQITSEKPRALIYIDDKGYSFENWKNTMNFMKGLQS